MRRISVVGTAGSGKTTLARSDPTWADLTFVRLRSHAQIAGFLADLGEPHDRC